MGTRVIRKAIRFLIIDIIIIIGIFVLQFRNDSTIIEKNGNLQIVLAESKTSDNVSVLQNYLQVNYNGIIFTATDQNPALIKVKNEKERKPVELISWRKTNVRSYQFDYSNGIELIIDVSDEKSDSPLSVSVIMPSDVEHFYLPYSYSRNMQQLDSENDRRVILKGRNSTWNLYTHGYEDEYVSFSENGDNAHYSLYDDKEKFTFDSIVNLALADESIYKSSITSLRNNFISLFNSSLRDGSYNESSVVAYVAAMAENGDYLQAIENIPSSFKQDIQRTYLSAPYFDSLANMNIVLENEISVKETQIKKTVDSFNLDIYTMDNLANFLAIHSNPKIVSSLLSKTAAYDLSECTLSQASGIVSTYVELTKLNPDYAKYLTPIINTCIEKITQCCSYEGDTVALSENDTFVSVVQAVETGSALIRYGKLSGNNVLEKGGHVIINSYLSDNSSFDMKTLSRLYTIMAYDNWYYPHFELINTNEKGNKVWAWTVARSITYKKDADDTIRLTIDFPVTYTHYLIIKGIESFDEIYIYDMQFRTDPRFENYNSSGYVYVGNNGTLLLKSRHRSESEVIRLVYKPDTPSSSPVTDSTVTESEQSAVSTEKEAVPTPVENHSDANKAESSAKSSDLSGKSTELQTNSTDSPEATYSVVLENTSNARKVNIINIIRAFRPDLTYNEANDMYKQVEAKEAVVVKEGMTLEEADDFIAKITNVNGIASKR
jgi:hypothetical protein